MGAVPELRVEAIADRIDRAELFTRLCEPQLGQMLGAAHLITGNREDAADVVQDALTDAWESFGRLRNEGSFGGWLRRIVIRKAWKRANSNRRQDTLPAQLTDDVDSLERAVSARRLRTAFGRIAAADRIILTLHYFFGLTSVEIGDALSIPEGTAKSRLHHALQRARAAYDAEDRR